MVAHTCTLQLMSHSVRYASSPPSLRPVPLVKLFFIGEEGGGIYIYQLCIKLLALPSLVYKVITDDKPRCLRRNINLIC